MSDAAIAELRLHQLASPALPVGAFTHSEGLESAVDLGHVTDESSAARWILGQLDAALASLDVPVYARAHAAFAEGDDETAARWSRRLIAARGTSELRASDRRGGQALARLLTQLGIVRADPWADRDESTFTVLFALACAEWRIAAEPGARACLWAWCENQVAAAIKLVPLGQSAGQRILLRTGDAIPEAVERGLALDDDDIRATTPGVAMASAWHEVQYTRLFRS